MKRKFDIEGMTCAACQLTIEKAVKFLGVNDVKVSLLTNSMEVDSDIDENKIIKKVEEVGYKAISKIKKENNSKEDINKVLLEEKKSLKYKLMVSIPLMIILMYVAMGEMLGFPYPKFLSHKDGFGLNAYIQLLLTIPVIVINRNYFLSGFKALFKGHPNMDSLVAIGSGSALVYALYSTGMINYALSKNNHQLMMKYAHDLYFETSAMILALISLGKFLEVKSKMKTTDSINKLINLQPDTVVIVKDDKEEVVDLADIKKGDIIKIVPGERIAIDGIVIEGSSSIDTSPVTGESMPVDISRNDNVISGSINNTGTFLMKATKVGDDTTISKIISLMEEASMTKAPISKLADKVSGIFVPVVILISLLSFLYWIFLGKADFSFAISIAIAVLVISCPCALGLATPVAIMVATGKAAENGILVKNSESLETLSKIDTIVFDKTGTITKGKPILTDIITINNFDRNKAVELAYSLEKDSQHPLAIGIINFAKKLKIEALKISNFDSVTGKGVKGEIEGKNYYIGNKKFAEENIEFINNLDSVTDKLSNEGKTIVYLLDENSILAIFAISDTIKTSSLNAINQLKKQNINTVMLTGDNLLTAENIAKRVGIDKVYAELLPLDKDKIIREVQESGEKVAMVGDGINDSVALIRSDVGIAIADGTDIAIESSDMVLMKSNLEDILAAINLSKLTLRNIKQNLFWAFFYNIIGIPIAMGVFYNSFGLKLNPMIGALAMSMSSIFVITNSLRLKIFNIDYTKEKDDEILSNEVVYDNIETVISKGDTTMNKKIINIEGMSCEHCKKSVERELSKISKRVFVSLEEKKAEILADSNITDDVIISTIENAGYEVVSIEDAE